MKQLWAIHDKKIGSARQIGASQIKEYNENGYGIFLSVNEFSRNRPRREENIMSLNSFYADFDNGTKEQQIKVISKCLRPSAVVESRNGFHCYWNIKNNMIAEMGKDQAIENYKLIQQLIINCTGADKSVKDAARVLRLPDTLHLKGEPFLVKQIYSSDCSYHSYDMLKFFSPGYKPKNKQAINLAFSNSGEFWDNIVRYGAAEGLVKLSGAEELNGDVFEIKNNQIWVNGKFSSSWIDEENNIGSHGNGGPTIVQWIMWYGHSKGEAAEIIKKYIPEIEYSGIVIGGVNGF